MRILMALVVLVFASACGEDSAPFGGDAGASGGSSGTASSGGAGGAAGSGGSGASTGGQGPGGASGGGAGQGGFDPAKDPTASIFHPGDGQCRVVGVQIDFVGEATDPQDGMLKGAALVWTSSLDGQIGTGNQFKHAPSKVGADVITLEATDLDGNVGSDAITLDVKQSCP